MHHTVPYDPSRHGGILPPIPLPEPESLGDWSAVEPHLDRLCDQDQDVIEMLRWGVSRTAVEMILDITEAALAMRLAAMRRRIQYLLVEPEWDRDLVMADIGALPGVTDPRIPEAWADWLWGPQSASWYGRKHGLHQHYTCCSWLGRSDRRRGRTGYARWNKLTEETRAAILWRRAGPTSFHLPIPSGMVWTARLTRAARDVVVNGMTARTAGERHGLSMATVTRAAGRVRWTDQHRPVWAEIPDPYPPLVPYVDRRGPKP